MEIAKLPEECISHIISFTSPKDACRSCLVCPLFRSASDSDVVWRKFLPHDYHQILSNSASASSMDSLSRKKLYFHLCDNPIIIDSDQNMSFNINKESGKKCYMIGARRLSIPWGITPAYWRWPSLPAESRFSRVAVMELEWWLHIKGRMETNILSPKTTYGAYFVYKFNERSRGFKGNPVDFQIYFEGEEEVDERMVGSRELLNRQMRRSRVSLNGQMGRSRVFLNPSEDERQIIRVREDGWLEVEMGEFFNDGGDDHRVVVCRLMETDSCVTKIGLVVEGIEFRPKSGT
ncbi:F-box protein PP2-B10-like [Ziziphus jujuba]|uniref:F-box protein PP2-B10-like n=1 Tax=Ziziphus jujuba TaxID=326968 RepID=A0A6P3ZZ09_ZIZJJ|nr:F-box protein PP2-B10-like [Ziziphus jujuba]